MGQQATLATCLSINSSFHSRISHAGHEAITTMRCKAACTLLLTRPPRTTKSVKFSNSCDVVMIRTPASEGISTWYARQEYQSIRVLYKQDVAAFARAKRAGAMAHFDANRYCLRGLERYFRPKGRRYAGMTKQRVHAILKHQHQQQSCGFKNLESLALLSETLSKGARERAIELARNDAMVWCSPFNQPVSDQAEAM